MVTFAGEIYFFLTFKDKKNKHRGWNQNVLRSHIAGLERRSDNFHEFLYLLKRGKLAKWKKSALVEMIGTTETLRGIPESFDIDNMTTHEASDLSHGILRRVTALGEQADLFESHLKTSFDPQPEGYMTALRKACALISEQARNIWWVLFDGSLPYYPVEDIMGMKGNVNFQLVIWEVGVDAEVTVSSEELMRCSDLYQYYDHIMPDPGGRIYRLAGSVHTGQVTMIGSKYRTLYSLLNILSIESGLGVEAAFSANRPLFAVKLFVKFRMLESQATGSLFITNDDVFGICEQTVMRLFRVRLTLGFAVPKQASNLAIWMNGRFIPGVDTAFNASLMEWSQRMLKVIKQDTGKKT